MKNNIIISAVVLLMFIAFISSAYAEVYSYTDTYIDHNENTVKNHLYLQLLDTSSSKITINIPVPFQLIANFQDLPYNITANSSADYCTYTINYPDRAKYSYTVISTNFEGNGTFIGLIDKNDLFNRTIVTDAITYANQSAMNNVTQLYLRDDDSITADIICHYTDANDLYINNILVGQISAVYPAIACDGCGDKSLEQLVNYKANISNEVNTQNQVYGTLDKVSYYNYYFWLVFKYFFYFATLAIALTLIFKSITFTYRFVKSIEVRR